MYSVPTLLTRTSGVTGFSCGECKVFSFAVSRRICLVATTVEILKNPSVGEHRRSDGLLLMLSKLYYLTPLKPMALWCRKSSTVFHDDPKKGPSATRRAVQSSSSNQTISDHRSSGTCAVKRRARSAMR